MLFSVNLGAVNASDRDLKRTEMKSAVQEMVKKAIVYHKKHGRKKTLTEMSNPRGAFVQGSLYCFAYDLEGTVIAHPINSSLIGGKLHDIPDESGKFFRREIIFKAKKHGSGWVEYRYTEPKSGKVQQKITYFEKYDNIIFCCGFYW
jgi:signal transduction histidine kinase